MKHHVKVQGTGKQWIRNMIAFFFSIEQQLGTPWFNFSTSKYRINVISLKKKFYHFDVHLNASVQVSLLGQKKNELKILKTEIWDFFCFLHLNSLPILREPSFPPSILALLVHIQSRWQNKKHRILKIILSSASCLWSLFK